MARDWTPEQLKAIKTLDKTLLISAAAGSGKTATLTERIIRSILEHGMSIKDMLIATFTTAATAKLSSDIGDALRKKIIDLKTNTRLEAALKSLDPLWLFDIDKNTKCEIGKRIEHYDGEEHFYRTITPEIIPELVEYLESRESDAPFSDILKMARERLLETESVLRFEEEIRLLPSAQIRTIDGFCGDIFRQHCEKVGINPGYRILDEAEASLIGDGILDIMIERIYSGELTSVATAAELSALAECLTKSRNQNDLTAIIRVVHHDTKNLEDGVHRIRKLVEEYNPEKFTTVEATTYGAHAMAVLKEYTEHFIPLLKLHIAANEPYVNPKKKKPALRISTLTNDLLILERLDGAKNYLEAREVFSDSKFEDMGSRMSLNADEKGFIPNVTPVRKAMRDGFEKISKYFSYSEEEWRETYEGLYTMLKVLASVTEEFDRAFTAEKKRIGACEFSDVARYTYECLWQDGKPTPVAISEAKKYKAIYVDEYQDVNEIQHRILEAISGEDNRFMVGDVKQAIYGFRGADSSIFTRLKTGYPDISVADGSYANINMANNFRSDRGIIDFANRIFSRVFPVIKDSVGYVPEDDLVFSKKYPNLPTEPKLREPKLCLLPSSGKKGVLVDDEEDTKLEPLFVAELIRDLIDHGKKNNGMKIEAGDIAIILRSTSGRDADFARALEALDVPYALSDSAAFFLNPEVLLLLSILNVIDNPHKDVYLAATLMSPIFHFTVDDLAVISKGKKGSLYSALKSYSEENSDFFKGSYFLRWLAAKRSFAEGCAVDVLINRIFRETGILTFARGEEGRACLNRFYEHARMFEASSFKGLYNFINYVNGVIERKNSFNTKDANMDPNSVKIITSHSSKGLDFPVVIHAFTSYSFKHESKSLIFNADLGISMKLRSKSGLSVLNNPTYDLLSEKIYRRTVEEEARVLYVALTRAEERLYVIGTPRRGVDKIIGEVEEQDQLTPYVIYNFANYIDMIALGGHIIPVEPLDVLPGMSDALREAIWPTVEEVLADEDGSAKEPDDVEKREKSAPVSNEFDEFGEFSMGDEPLFDVEGGSAEVTSRVDEMYNRLSFIYPEDYMTRLPEKLSVSRLYPDILDEKENTEVWLEELAERKKHYNMERLPSFAVGGDLTESAKRGIATHLLFQFCDFEALKKNGTASELDRLVREKFISEDDRKRVREKEVDRFIKSALIDEIIGAKKLYRELRFNVRMPASLFSEDDKTKAELDNKKIEVLVQGVIDCLYEDGDGRLHLVDYKTDRFTSEEYYSPALAEEKMRNSHGEQLEYYAIAIERMLGRRPDTVEVYALQLGRCIDVAKK